MGLPNWLHWTAWFTKTFMFMMISVILIVILTKVPWYPDTDLAVFSLSDTSLLLVFFIFYVIASICYIFLISVLFSTGTLLHNVVFCLLPYLMHVFLIIMANSQMQ
jgi:ATP-binding cassette subfamily A (ABC1) protein 3